MKFKVQAQQIICAWISNTFAYARKPSAEYARRHRLQIFGHHAVLCNLSGALDVPKARMAVFSPWAYKVSLCLRDHCGRDDRALLAKTEQNREDR